MSVTIIGAGNMARGIGSRFAAAGIDVQVQTRNPAQADELAKELGPNATGSTLGDEITGDVVVLALPYAAAVEVARNNASALENKTVVDISNPVDFSTFDSLVTPSDSSAAQEIQKLLPHSPVVKAFNTVFSSTLEGGAVAGQPLDVPIASDDDGAKKAVAELIETSGLRAIDAGSLRRAHELEALGFLHIGIQQNLGTQFASAVKFIA